MHNREIARKFNELAKIMELHGENPFKIRSYQNAYNTLRKIEGSLATMSKDQLSEIPGVGKAIADKIIELSETGNLKTYQKYADITPEGIIEMLKIRGFGPKKIKVIWKDLEVVSIGELLYACNENRLVELKGFGEKTQEQLKKQLKYYIDSQGKYLFGFIIDDANKLMSAMSHIFSGFKHSFTGGLRKLDPIVSGIEILTTVEDSDIQNNLDKLGLTVIEDKYFIEDYPVKFHHTPQNTFGSSLLESSSSSDFLHLVNPIEAETEEEIFQKNGLKYIKPEFRDYPEVLHLSQERLDNVIKNEDVKGVIHAHSTYSDGIHSIKEMAMTSKSLGYEYLVMSDHSKIAVYANGLTENAVFAQAEEINRLNVELAPFKIFKGIEADILSDGDMDYGNDFLKNFEVVIASVHSGLRMDKNNATNRIIKAVENPYTHILGHPTGRLLLSREGYPIDHMKVIDACAANGMVIELNANPLRLDIDWTWIPYALEKEVMISINPDSHNKESISYIKFGVNVARKALLPKGMCLNYLGLTEFSKWLKNN
jgi:DNA polymerase (family 10)